MQHTPCTQRPIAYCVLRIDLLRIAYCVLGIGSGWGTLFAIAYCVLRIAYCVLRDTVYRIESVSSHPDYN